MVLAYHLIITGYGHWLPNDPRGSLSTEFRNARLADLGPIHHGRQKTQPPRSELVAFQRHAREKLQHAVLWFDDAKRQAIAEAFGRTIARLRYTCWAAAILANHAHLVIRKHRDKAEQMIESLRKDSTIQLRRLANVPNDHPIWSSDPYKKYLDSPEAIERTIRYVEENPARSDRPPQRLAFIKPYRGEWRTTPRPPSPTQGTPGP